jgi:hypothetical protein
VTGDDVHYELVDIINLVLNSDDPFENEALKRMQKKLKTLKKKLQQKKTTPWILLDVRVESERVSNQIRKVAKELTDDSATGDWRSHYPQMKIVNDEISEIFIHHMKKNPDLHVAADWLYTLYTLNVDRTIPKYIFSGQITDGKYCMFQGRFFLNSSLFYFDRFTNVIKTNSITESIYRNQL